MNTRSIEPVFGTNYCEGYIGFQFTDTSFISQGIAYFERWDRMHDIKVSHVFVVEDEDVCIEAMPQGIVRNHLNERFHDPHTHVFFRKPKDWNLWIGEKIAGGARMHLGDSYGYGIILADLLANCLLGRWLNELFHNDPNRTVSKWLDGRKSEICSELGAKALKEAGYSHGVLELPPRMVTPQNLFEDDITFEEWKKS